MHSVGSTDEDEETDPYIEDYRKAQSIREAAQAKDTNAAIPSAGNNVPPAGMPNITDLSSTPGEVDDPFSYLADEVTSHLPEQRGSVSIPEPDEGVHDISEEPTGLLYQHDIVDLGDTEERFNQQPSSPGSTRARILPARNRTYRDHHECTAFARAQIVQVACKNRGRIVAVKMLWRPRRSMTRERVFRVRVESCQSKAISQPPIQ